MRVLAVLVTALFAAGCGSAPSAPGTADPAATVQHSARAEPSVGPVVTIDSAQALTIALEAAGITDVHPVKTNNGAIGAWAAAPKFKKCPVYIEVRNGDAYSVTHMRKTNGDIVPMDMEGYAISPTALDLADWAANNVLTVGSCLGNSAPAAGDWPTTQPTA